MYVSNLGFHASDADLRELLAAKTVAELKFQAAEKRLRDAWKAGFIPYAMLYRDEKGIVDSEWRKFQRLWVRPAIVMSQLKESDGR